MTASRPRVLLASPRPPPVGGIATWTEAVLASPLAREFELRCVDTAPRDATDRPSESRFRPARAGLAITLVVRMAGECLRFRPALVHICTSYHWGLARDAIFLVLARASGARSVLHLRGGDFAAWADALPAPFRKLAWGALRLADRVIVLDEATRARVASEVGQKRVALLQSFVETPTGSPSAPGQASAVESAPLRVVFVGAVIEAKGVLELLEAAAAVPEVQLALAGAPDRSLRPRLDAALAKLGGRARLEGVLEPSGVAALLRDADVFALPSHREGLPISLLEAMAAGLAIVATPVGAIPEVVRDGQEGLLVPVGDAAALASALRSLARDRLRCRAFGARAKSLWRERFSRDAGIGRLRALWEEMAAR